MLGFMDHVQQAWSASSSWDRDNSYGALNASARALLDFQTPVGLALNLSSLASPSFANSYTLSNSGIVGGSLSYLYSSVPLTLASRSTEIPLRSIIHGYRQLQPLKSFEQTTLSELWQDVLGPGRKNTLLYGRLYLPQSLLEALYMRRISPTSQLKISCVSSSMLKSGGSILVLFSRDLGKHSSEYLYSTDSGLVGVRGLYNFGADPRIGAAEGNDGSPISDLVPSKLEANGRFSAGAELYYGLLNKTGGMSVGCRFATLPRHPGFPYTMTLTANPLMGNLSSTYAVKAGPALSLATRFDFNVYSYESQFQVGLELWKRRNEADGPQWAIDKIKESERKGWVSDSPARSELSGGDVGIGSSSKLGEPRDEMSNVLEQYRDEDIAGVLKARMSQDGALGLLWEGRVKQLLYSFGLNVDLRQRENIFRGVGLEFHYSS